MIKVLTPWDKSRDELKGFKVVLTVSKSKFWEKGLSPFTLGPCKLHSGLISRNMENAWQYSKVYKEHVGEGGWPIKKWWKWAKEGWNNPRAVRYPMGKGRKPEYSYWIDIDGEGHQLSYVEARKVIYGPLYIKAVRKTSAWEILQEEYRAHKNLVLLDYDAYDHRKLGMTLKDVLNNPDKKMGHAFVLAMMLTKDKALEEMEL